MTLLDWTLRAIGGFYMFAGIVLVRAICVSRVIDAALARLGGGGTTRVVDAKAVWHLANAVLIFAGGAALALLLDLSAWLFTLSSLLQALYFVWLAPRVFDAGDPPDATGRRQSINAFLIYLVVTGLVLWAARDGRFSNWQETPWPLLALASIAVIGLAGYAARHGTAPLASTGMLRETLPSARGEDAGFDLSGVRRIKVMAEIGRHPLWTIDEGWHADFPPDALGLTTDLCQEIEQWSAAYATSTGNWEAAWTDEQRAGHLAAARLLAERIAAERPDLVVFVLEPGIGVVQVNARSPGAR
jgi:hypothetical protein